MSGRPPFRKHTPRLCLDAFGKAAQAAPAPVTSRHPIATPGPENTCRFCSPGTGAVVNMTKPWVAVSWATAQNNAQLFLWVPPALSNLPSAPRNEYPKAKMGEKTNPFLSTQ